MIKFTDRRITCNLSLETELYAYEGNVSLTMDKKTLSLSLTVKDKNGSNNSSEKTRSIRYEEENGTIISYNVYAFKTVEEISNLTLDIGTIVNQIKEDF